MWWVNPGQQPYAHAAPHSFPLLNRTGGENKMKKLEG